MNATITINETLVTFRPLTVREVYEADLMPPNDPALFPLYLTFESDYPLITKSADCAPELLLDAIESDVQEAFRKANPFVMKPLQVALREQKNKTLASLFSEQSANLLEEATPTPGATPSKNSDGRQKSLKAQK